MEHNIEENDGFPQHVCVQCVGSVEFICDFYDVCHRTQERFKSTSQVTKTTIFQRESNVETDKENIAPLTNDSRHKIKTSLESFKVLKNCSSNNNALKIGQKEDEDTSNVNINLNRSEEHSDTENSTLSFENQTKSVTSQLLPTEKKHKIPEKLIQKDDNLQEAVSETKLQKATRKRGVNILTETNAAQSENTTYPEVNCNQHSESNRQSRPKLVIKRKKLKKNRTDSNNENFLELCDVPITCPKDNNIEINNATSINRDISNIKDEEIKKNSSGELMQERQFTEQKGNEGNERSSIIIVEKTIDKQLKKNSQKLHITHSSETKSMIIKQKKIVESIEENHSGPNNFVRIPNLIAIPLNNKPEQMNLLDITLDITNNATELNQVNGSGSSIVTLNNIENKNSYSEIIPDQNESVIKVIATEVMVKSPILKEPCDKLDTVETMHQDSRISSSCVQLNHENNGDSKSNIDKYRRISDLISEEDKNTIESYYHVDKSVIDQEQVDRNITILQKNNIKCNICNTLYNRLDKCRVHIWKHLNMKPYQCKACHFSTLTVTNIRCHIRKSHLKIKPFACHICRKQYVSRMLLEEHINVHTGERPFKCNVCDFASTSRQMLKYHIVTHKPIKDIKCDICGNMFYSKSRLRAHSVVHNRDKVVMCKLCSAYLSSEKALEIHHQNVHTRSYVCDICGKSMKCRKALHNHQNVHSDAKYKCTRCPNVYKTKHILMEHLLKHDGIRKYKCTVCEKSFSQKSHLAAHMAVHSEVRFHCPGCNKPFNRHDNMKIHTKRCVECLSRSDLKSNIIRKKYSKSLNKTEKIIKHDNITKCTTNEDKTIATTINENKTDTNLEETNETFDITDKVISKCEV